MSSFTNNPGGAVDLLGLGDNENNGLVVGGGGGRGSGGGKNNSTTITNREQNNSNVISIISSSSSSSSMLSSSATTPPSTDTIGNNNSQFMSNGGGFNSGGGGGGGVPVQSTTATTTATTTTTNKAKRSSSSGTTGPWASMLEGQWKTGCNSFQSSRLHVVICAKRCIVPGGIDTILKYGEGAGGGAGGGSAFAGGGGSGGGVGSGGGTSVLSCGTNWGGVGCGVEDVSMIEQQTLPDSSSSSVSTAGVVYDYSNVSNENATGGRAAPPPQQQLNGPSSSVPSIPSSSLPATPTGPPHHASDGQLLGVGSGGRLSDDYAHGTSSSYSQSGGGNKGAASSLLGRNAKMFAGRVMRASRAATDKIERSVTGLALRAAEQSGRVGGKNVAPDSITAIMYLSQAYPISYPTSARNFYEIGRTESMPLILPMMDWQQQQSEQQQQLLWSIPLSLPNEALPPESLHQDCMVMITLVMKSGSVNLFGGRQYPIGRAYFSLRELLSSSSSKNEQQQQGRPPKYKFTSIVQSRVLGPNAHPAAKAMGASTNPVLELFVLKNKKYPGLGQLGWSLTDPMPDCCAALGKMFCPPLEQMYVFPVSAVAGAGGGGGGNVSTTTPTSLPPASSTQSDEFFASNSVVAIERTQESTVVLPTVVCLTRLFAQAAMVSFQHANSVLTKSRSDWLTFTNPMDAFAVKLGRTHADCSLELCEFINSDAPFSSPGRSGRGCAEQVPPIGGCTVKTFLRSPSTVFEIAIGASSSTFGRGGGGGGGGGERMPVYHRGRLSASGDSLGGSSRVANVTLPFHPLVCSVTDDTTTRTGKKLSLGTLRFEIYLDAAPEQQAAALDAMNNFGMYSAGAAANAAASAAATAAQCGVVNCGPGSNASGDSVMSSSSNANSNSMMGKVTAGVAGMGVGGGIGGGGGGGVTLEAFVDLDPYINTETNTTNPSMAGGRTIPAEVPVHDVATNRRVGTLLINLLVRMVGNPMNTGAAAAAGQQEIVIPPANGLVSLLGMSSLSDGTVLDSISNAPQHQQQQQQHHLPMGELLTIEWLNQHVKKRQNDAEMLMQRYNSYARALLVEEAHLQRPPHERKCPSPYRPSSSKMDLHLSGLPFNVHVQSLVVERLDNNNNSTKKTATTVGGAGGNRGEPFEKTYWHNVTCGAAADHYRGFTSSNNKPGGSGGCRRLETKRDELSKLASVAKNELHNGIRRYLSQQQQIQQSQAQTKQKYRYSHVRYDDQYVNYLRSKAIQTQQNLVDVTWELSMRKVNILSQVIGIGLTSYLASLSDANRVSEQSAQNWKRYGFLLCFEGLLSAAGKEHGMIEDASKAIEMLRMVQVRLVDSNAASMVSPQATGVEDKRVEVVGSRVIRWMEIDWDRKSKNATAATTTPWTQQQQQQQVVPSSSSSIMITVALEPAFYNNRVPLTIRDQQNSGLGIPVRFYSILFQMGVDIRQWGANATSKLGNDINKASLLSPGVGGGGAGTGGSGGRRGSSDALDRRGSDDGGDAWPENDLEEDEDASATPDNDFLVTLNYEAFRALNRYAYAVSPQPQQQPSHPQAQQQQVITGPGGETVHPVLHVLWGNVRDSARKMEHGVLDSAARSAERLGGSGIIFCKSGKDRTAMQATLKQAQFLNWSVSSRILPMRQQQQYQQGRGTATGLGNSDTTPNNNTTATNDNAQILADATLMRMHGTRLAICEKNVGQPKFAFNALQVRFMPEMLKPPLSSVAGFLKGGKLFTGGGIES